MARALINPQLVASRGAGSIIEVDSGRSRQKRPDPFPEGLALDDEMSRLLQFLQHTHSADREWAVGIVSCFPREGVSSVARGLARVASHGSARGTLLCEVSGLSTPRTVPGNDLSDLLAAESASLESFAAVLDTFFVTDRLAQGSIRDPGLLRIFAADEKKTRASVEVLKSAFGHVIVDLPPMSEGVTALSLGRALDSVILVVEAEKTSARAVRAARDSIDGCGGKVLGVVLNKRRYSVPLRLRGLLP